MVSDRVRAVILTALPVEYESVRRCLRDLEPRVHLGSHYETGVFVPEAGPFWEILIAEIGAGNATAAAEAERAMQYFEPNVALFVGVAGGVKDVALGDVVIADRIYGYHAGKAKEEFETRPDVGQAGYEITQAAMACSREWNRNPARSCSTRVAPIAAGEQVIASTKSPVFAFLKRCYGNALAVEMEGRGFLAATRMNANVQALVVRGISDLIDGKAVADESGSQGRAAENAATFAMTVLARYAAGKTPNPP